MDEKTVVKSQREVTHLDLSKISKARSADYLYKSLSAGSKHRLRKYQENLMVTRGHDKPLFDDQLKDLLLQYVKDPVRFQEVLDYLNGLEDENGIKFSRNYKLYEFTQLAFETFSLNDYSSFRWNKNYRKTLEEIKLYFRKSGHLKPLSYRCDRDIVDAIPKKDTHSGWTYILSGFKEKGDNMDNIFKLFQKELSSALERGTLSKPIMVGFRTQASGEFDDEGKCTDSCKHKTRVVCMVDLIQIILELKYAKPVQNMMANMPFYAGGKDPSMISSIINNGRKKYPTWWSIDYSKFDMTISSWLIEDAFDIVREAFSFVDEREFSIIKHDFIHKDFVVGEGIVHADRGVPSGSMFTQIIDSIVNLIVVKTYFNSINKRCDMISMGDDNLIFCDQSPEDVSLLSTYLNKNFGLETNAEKSSVGTKKQDPEFLSRFWRIDGQWRHPNLLISRMLFPERFRNYSGQIGPEHVLHAFILTYYLGMRELVDVWKFRQDYPISQSLVWKEVDSKYLPGALAYIREYT